jgi:serine/threonine protein kinase/tetratricopeptide (TPR) repeat protein
MSEPTKVNNRCVNCGKEFSGDEIVCPEDGGILIAAKKDPAIGTIIAEKYEIQEVLGGGGMGVVYKAKHLLMQRTVAIKMLLPEVVSNEFALARFQKEAQAASSLNHPNILTIFDFGISEKQQPYLVMDYLKGGTLAETLEKESYLHLQNGISVFIQIASALSHAHQKGVIHRDLKPANIMLVEYEGQGDFVKIVDFGIAKTLSRGDGQSVELTQTGQVFGSPIYMSPEQCRGTHLDARTDIYSMGCVMYRSITGSTPFLGQDALELMYKQVNQKPACFDDVCPHLKIPKNFEDVVMKCLEKDANNRYQTMLDLRKDLEGVGGTSINSPFIFPATEVDNSKTPMIGALSEQRSTLNEIIAQSESQKKMADEIAEAQLKLLKVQREHAAARAWSTANPTGAPVDPKATGNGVGTGTGTGAAAGDVTAGTAANIEKTASKGTAAQAGTTAATSEIAITGAAAGTAAGAATNAPTTGTQSLPASSTSSSTSVNTVSEASASANNNAAVATSGSNTSSTSSPPQQAGATAGNQTDKIKLISIAVVVGALILIPVGIMISHSNSSDKTGSDKGTTSNTTKSVGSATTSADKSAAVVPGKANDELNKGRDLFEHGKYVEAKDSLTTAYSLATLNKDINTKFESLVLLGLIDAAEGDADGARSKFYAVVSHYNRPDTNDKPSDKEAATAFNGLGVISTNEGMYSRAHKHFKTALELRQKMPPKDSDVEETLTGMGNLALLEGHYKQALDYFTNAKKTSEASNGPETADTANILNDMGQAYQFLKKYDDADSCYKQALDIRRSKLSPTDPAIASSEMCMAALAFKKNDYVTSEKLFQDALSIDSKAIGTDNLVVAQIYFSLGVLYQTQKKYDQAADYYSKALEIQKQKLEPTSIKISHTKALLDQVKSKKRR